MNILELPRTVGATLMIVIAIILLDFILGVLINIKGGTFDFKKLPQFVCSAVLPYVGGLLVLAVVAQYITTVYLEIFLTVSGLVMVKYIAEVKIKISRLFGVIISERKIE